GQLGCGGPSSLSDGNCGGAPCPSPPTVSVAWQMGPVEELDLLVVVDDTANAAPVASAFPAKLAQLADVLAHDIRGQAPLHVAFIGGSVGSAGCTPPRNRAAACGLPASDDFLTADYCGAQPNFTGTMSDAFACLADSGAGACGTFQPLEAAHRALADAAQGGLRGRSGFWTPGAQLAVLIVATQDDASPRPVADYLAEFESRTVYAFLPMLVAPTGCPADGPIAPADPLRLVQFAGGGPTISLCDPSFNTVLTPAVTVLDSLLLTPALTGARDTDPIQPGLQARCAATDDVTEADGTHVITQLPACDATASVKPCLSINWDFTAWRPHVVRGLDPVAPACGPFVTRDRVTCAGCADPADPACAATPPESP
ncbi:MAG TPA: hypothetical protein VLT58_06260, partial [Polyangia bacterium]|nr:hypothetical protein [Polyangia bacterium]